MAKPKVTEREVRVARQFLKSIHGNQSNGYLLLAVIAWMRSALSRKDKFFRSLAKYSPVKAGALLAAKLRARIKAKPNDYRGLLKRIDDVTKSPTSQFDQGQDFLMSIAMSSWDASHYGYKPATEGRWIVRPLPNGTTERLWVPPVAAVQPTLLKTFSGLLGVKIPDSYFIDSTTTTTKPAPAPPVKPDPPRQPRSLKHSLIEGDYIQPYAARAFYEAKPHSGDFTLEPVDGLA